MGGTCTDIEGTVQAIEAANLVARPTKCVFGATQVDFWGHCLAQGMIGLQAVNVQKMRDAPRPTAKKK